MKYCNIINHDKVLVANSNHESYAYVHTIVTLKPIMFLICTSTNTEQSLLNFSRAEFLAIMFNDEPFDYEEV